MDRSNADFLIFRNENREETLRRGESSSRWRLRNALQMRPPHPDAAAPPFPLRRNLLRQNLAQIAVGDEQIRHGNTTAGLLRRRRRCPVTARRLSPLPLRCRRSRSGFLRRRRGQRHEKINFAALELGVGLHDDDPRAHTGFRW